MEYGGMKCIVKIKMEDEALNYKRSYVFGPYGCKDEDYIHIPMSFLQKGIDMVEYDFIKEVTIKIKSN